MGESLPFPVQFVFCRDTTKRIAEADKETLDGLERAGFKVDWGVDDGGIGRLYFTRGGGYYVDVGCSKLIVHGKIKVHQSPKGIEGFTGDELVLADGTKLPADVVVLATGYDNMKTTAEKVMGSKVAARAKDVWDLDEEGELNAVSSPEWMCKMFKKLTMFLSRCGVQVVIPISGTWAETWLFAEFIPNTWLYKSKHRKRDSMFKLRPLM